MLHLKTPSSSDWKSLPIIESSTHKQVGVMVDNGDEYVNRYEARLFEGTLYFAEGEIIDALRKAEHHLKHVRGLRQQDAEDADRVKQALENVSMGVRALFDEMQMWGRELTAEIHRNVRRPDNLKNAQTQHDRIMDAIANVPITFRGMRIICKGAAFNKPWEVGEDDSIGYIQSFETLAEALEFVDLYADH